ncbi:hypothetical protein TSUD_247000 [Trifolium subterraneum]|uniref:Methyltransferase n=1 Tax=Trifolium subterraneum TaxID=3900 RepID=A0A2Z6P1W9_TRISU|nr:hypothetical protein TSUD_247000 [Trifolium subterraneum]
MASNSNTNPNPNPKSLITNLLFISLLLFTNLITLFLSTTYNSSTCTPNFTTTTTSTAVEDDSRKSKFPPEFFASTSPQKLPLGFNRNFNSDTVHPPAGSACTLFPEDLRRYMSYDVNGSCPDDEILSQRLLLKGCEPLPRRRCRPATPPNFPPPTPFPTSLWSTPSDSSVVWTAYTCKSYMCLIERSRTQRGFDDCKDCFDLNGREKNRWTNPKSNGLDFSIDDVLKTRKPGSIRTGLDIGGGVATVLRPGGLFWLDHFFCVGDQLENVYGPMIESVGFKKVKWVTGKKLDKGPQFEEMYLSALLEKPFKDSW